MDDCQRFQSLSRDSGRLNEIAVLEGRLAGPLVSIPQSGFGAFEPRSGPRNAAVAGGFNPSVGIRGV